MDIQKLDRTAPKIVGTRATYDYEPGVLVLLGTFELLDVKEIETPAAVFLLSDQKWLARAARRKIDEENAR